MNKNTLIYIIAVFLLLIMFLLAVFSIKDDTFTFDETAHIAAGYSYLTQQDYRMNPEHPPLIKDLAAFPLLFLNLNFPKDKTWTDASPARWWNQFDFGSQLLYNARNNPDKILFWSRIPMILVLLFLGVFLFFFAKKLWGNKAALIALFLFSFFPTFLAHGRLVTTDAGAAFGTVFSTYFWLEFLKSTTKKSLILAGLAFGAALLIKFSLILLLPFFIFITVVYALLKNNGGKKYVSLPKYLALSFLAMIIGAVFVIWPVYKFNIAKYPAQRQLEDTKNLLATTNVPKIAIKLNIMLASNDLTRPLSQYFLGLLTATNRTTTGNTTYFLGKISADSWKSYFPVVYFIKNPLPFHILTLIAIFFAFWFILKNLGKNLFQKSKEWIKNHFAEFSMLSFLAIYWAASLYSALNIGVRHLLPVFPFTIMLVSAVVANLLKNHYLKIKYGILGALIFWQIISVITVYPSFLAYFNESVGGPGNGYKYATDSNLDWGQDLKRLNLWIEKHNQKVPETGCVAAVWPRPPQCVPIDKIYLDYFGGGNAAYYLKEKYIPWDPTKNRPSDLTSGDYIAVSVNQLQGGRAVPAKGFDRSSDYYRWLDQYTPIAKIGYSIFVYRID